MCVIRRYCNVGKLPASGWAVAAWMWIRWSGPRGLTRKSASMLSAVLWPTRKGVRVGMEATGSRQWLGHPPQTSGWTGQRNNQWPCPVRSNGRRQYHGSSNTTWNENQPGYVSLQGPLADMDLSLHNFSFCGWPQVVWELSVATIMNLAWIQRYQIKDMGILFPLVPYNPILSEWLGHSDLAKLGVFWCFSWFPHALEICIQILIFKFTPFKDGAT